MIIYVDVLILENFIVNLFLLILTMRVIKHKSKLILLITSSFIGGMYTVVVIIPGLYFFRIIPFEILIACIMLRIAYGKTNLINMIKLLGVFLGVTFTLSGICFLFSLKQNIYILGNTFEIQKYSIKYIMIGTMSIYIIYTRIADYVRDRIFVNNYNFNVQFIIGDKKYCLNGFLDTGNELREPITNLPCILIEENIISDIGFDGKNTYSIPYNSIGYGGNLKGIRVNNIKIENNNFAYGLIDAIICPCKEKMSGENEFNALLPRGIV